MQPDWVRLFRCQRLVLTTSGRTAAKLEGRNRPESWHCFGGYPTLAHVLLQPDAGTDTGLR